MQASGRNGYTTCPNAQEACTTFTISPPRKGPIQIEIVDRYHENAKQQMH